MSAVRRCEAERGAIELRLGQPTLRWDGFLYAVAILWVTGDTAGAELLADEALALGLETGQPDALVMYGQMIMGIRWHQGRDAEIAALIADYADDNPGLPVIRAFLAFRLASRGELDAARDQFAQLARDGFAFIKDATWLLAQSFAAQTAALLGDRDAGTLLLERLEPHRGLIASSGGASAGAVTHAMGCVAASLGRYEEAELLFTDALARHERLESPFFRSQTLLELADLIHARAIPSGLEVCSTRHWAWPTPTTWPAFASEGSPRAPTRLVAARSRPTYDDLERVLVVP